MLNCKKNSFVITFLEKPNLKELSENGINFIEEEFENLIKELKKNNIKFVKMGKIREAEKAIRPAVNYLMKIKCKKIILGCTELPIAIFAYKSFKKIKQSKVFVDPNLLVANVSMKKYKKLKKQ